MLKIFSFFNKDKNQDYLYQNFLRLSEQNEVVINSYENNDVLHLVILSSSGGIFFEKTLDKSLTFYKFSIKENEKLPKHILTLLIKNAEKISPSFALEHTSKIISSYRQMYNISFNEAWIIINETLNSIQQRMDQNIFYEPSDNNHWVD